MSDEPEDIDWEVSEERDADGKVTFSGVEAIDA